MLAVKLLHLFSFPKLVKLWAYAEKQAVADCVTEREAACATTNFQHSIQCLAVLIAIYP